MFIWKLTKVKCFSWIFSYNEQNEVHVTSQRMPSRHQWGIHLKVNVSLWSLFDVHITSLLDICYRSNWDRHIWYHLVHLTEVYGMSIFEERRLKTDLIRTLDVGHPITHWALAHRRNIASFSLFYRYYFGRCSSELAQLVPLHYS